ncbi:conserved hypothetical protein [Culex quinquefasciatus]|uniref:Uncharacterized protein n=1 Tax=Culex quinquefasciatus TaxID=7176 RepID=B0WYI5_CULQU|nr:conserved hypothetical protein [Culex quinquefasciatus]|eukprot:XP_001862457.1 conserved hypothetical protein [Culex quinquefasciatus]
MVDNTRVVMRVRLVLVVTRANTRVVIKELLGRLVNNTRVVMRVRLVLVVTRANTRVVIKELLGRLVDNIRVVMRGRLVLVGTKVNTRVATREPPDNTVGNTRVATKVRLAQVGININTKEAIKEPLDSMADSTRVVKVSSKVKANNQVKVNNNPASSQYKARDKVSNRVKARDKDNGKAKEIARVRVNNRDKARDKDNGKAKEIARVRASNRVRVRDKGNGKVSRGQPQRDQVKVSNKAKDRGRDKDSSKEIVLDNRVKDNGKVRVKDSSKETDQDKVRVNSKDKVSNRVKASSNNNREPLQQDQLETGISGSLMTSHNTTVHTGGTSIGGSVGTTGVHGSSSHNSSGSIFGATYNHTSVSSGSLDGQGVHGGHTGSNSFNSTHVSVSGNTDVEGHFQGGQVTVGGTVNHTETLAVGSVNVSSTSGGSFGGELGPEYVGGEVSGMLVTNASISAPLIGPQQGSVTVGGGGSIEVSTEYPYGPSPSQTPEPVYTTPQPNYPTASGVQPPTRPIETGPPPPSNNNNNQYPPYQIAVSQYPYFFVPYPYAPPPTVPQAPCNCPQDQNRPNQPAGYLGFIPVIYVPNCNAQQRGLPTHINWPAPPPPEGFGRALDQLPPFQRLVQGPDGSWTVQQDPQQQEAQQPQTTQQPLPRLRQNRGRRLRSRRPPLLQLAGVPFAKSSSVVGAEQETQVETQV